MKKTIWIAGILCLVLGTALVLIGAYFYTDTLDYQKLDKGFSGEITALCIDCDGQDVYIRPSADRNCRVSCTGFGGTEYSVELVNGVLFVTSKGETLESVFLRLFAGEAKVTVELPPQYFHEPYESLEVSTASGDILVEEGLIFQRCDLTASSGDVSFLADVWGRMNIETSSGDIKLADSSSAFSVHQVTLSTSSGDIRVEGQNAFSLSAQNASGDVTLDSCEIYELTVSCTSGDVELRYVDLESCNLQTISGDVSAGIGKTMDFHCSTTSGDIDIPPPATKGGLCQITTTSGDIRVWIYSENDPDRANRE